MVPLILTLRLDDAAFQYFNQLRKTHFPAERNFLDAHLTLFHHLPHTVEVIQQIQMAASQVPAPMVLEVSGVYKLGNGVAYRVESPLLVQLHRRLQQLWQPQLTRQDLQPLRPHVTIQNKVPPAEAERLFAQLAPGFKPFSAWGTGLTLWQYLGGPWQLQQQFTWGAERG